MFLFGFFLGREAAIHHSAQGLVELRWFVNQRVIAGEPRQRRLRDLSKQSRAFDGSIGSMSRTARLCSDKRSSFSPYAWFKEPEAVSVVVPVRLPFAPGI